MRAGRCRLTMSGRNRRAGAALLATVALGMLPCMARAQEGTSGGAQAPQPAQGELPEVKVEAPKAPKPPAKPVVAPKPARREQAVAPPPVAAPKPTVARKPVAAPGRVARPVAAPPPPSPEPIAATPDLIDVSPVAGSGIERDKIPANVPQPLGPAAFDNNKVPDLLQGMFQSFPFVTLGNQSGNQFQQDFDYRGFVASPVQGTPQGLAIYQNGVRINESYGDVINWDFIPQMAINRMTLQPNNPIFGLNAIGGAISIEMKNGFNYHGTEVDGLGGSFGRRTVAVQSGIQSGNLAIYATADATNDAGWKDLSSASYLRRMYLDFGAKGGEQTEFHLQFTGADNNLGAVAATPLELLNQRWSAVYTSPQATHLSVAFGEATASWTPTSTLSFNAVGYYRQFWQAHTDGNGTDGQPCDPSGALAGQLCIGDGNTPINQNSAVLNTLSPGAFLGEIDRNWTSTASYGGTIQATNTNQIFRHDNHVVFGVSVDHGRSQFNGNSELGTIDQNLFVTGQGVFVDQPAADLTPVGLLALNTYTGIYLTDTFDLTSQLSVTGGARYNNAQISLLDETGTNPLLNSTQRFQRINPVIGSTYKVLPNVTIYAGYSEANRAPTPLELGCSDPAHPCMIDTFLIADPPLQQVVSHTYEAGLRGKSGGDVKTGQYNWSFGAFRISTTNDIINVASAVVPMFGYFQNAAKTRRQGIEANFNYRQDRWTAYANYTFIDATYQTALTLQSPNNPAADADGNVFVVPGDHIPGIPNQRFKLGAEYNFTDEIKVGSDLNVIGSQYLIHDDSNQNPKVPAYWVVNLHASYQMTPHVQLFGLVQNLFNQHYYQAGTFFDTGGFNSNTFGGNNFATFNDPRTFLPGMPLAIYGGVKATF
jgi:iron complex outermembrane recepter protein